MGYVTAITLALLASAAPAETGERRFALLVGHPLGGEELSPLRYTGHDVERMREVLAMVGGFARDDIVVSHAVDASHVRDRFTKLRERVAAHTARSRQPTLFLFYYSGHAKDGELRLGASRLALTEIKRMVEQTGASVRIALLDACRSGSITRMKGAVKGEPISLAVDDSTVQQGQVLITASSEDEDAQESDDIQGSFFTHYLTNGLRGAADGNRDGKVTLSEAYAFAYAGTVSRTVGTRGGIQHPTYRFDLRGAGDVVLARSAAPPSSIVFPARASGQFVVFDLDREVVVAELDKDEGEELRLAVAPGDYVVKKREVDHLRMQRLSVRAKGVARLAPEHMERVAFADDYAKGAVVTAEEILHGRLGVRLSALVGALSFLSAPIRDAYVPTLGVVQLRLDLANALRRNLGVRLDVGFGGADQRRLLLRDPYLGELTYDVELGQMSAGVSLTADLPLREWLVLGASGRLGLIALRREFLDAQLPAQGFATITPGLGGSLEAHLTEWLRVGLGVGIHYVFFNADEPQSLAYIDGGLSLTVVMR